MTPVDKEQVPSWMELSNTNLFHNFLLRFFTDVYINITTDFAYMPPFM